MLTFAQTRYDFDTSAACQAKDKVKTKLWNSAFAAP